MTKADLKGKATAKRALEVAAVGSHSVMLWGSRGAGKSAIIAEAVQYTPEACAILFQQ